MITVTKKQVIGTEVYYSIADLAQALNCPYPTVHRRVVYTKALPQPDVRIGRRELYSAGLFYKIVGQAKENV